MLAGCSSGTEPASTNADITKVVGVKSSFGPEFKVADISERAIDPKLLSARKLPEGLTFDPANCAKVAVGPDMPADVQGNMAAVSAEGNGNRFVVIAVETSKPLPFNDPREGLHQGGVLRGPAARRHRGGRCATHRRDPHAGRAPGPADGSAGGPRTGELYDYSAQFGDYQVIVIANPLVVPDQPVAKIDTQRARDLLVKAVAAVRS